VQSFEVHAAARMSSTEQVREPSYWTRRRQIKASVAAFFDNCDTSQALRDHGCEGTSYAESAVEVAMDSDNAETEESADCAAEFRSMADDFDESVFDGEWLPSDSDDDDDDDDNDGASVDDCETTDDVNDCSLRSLLAGWVNQYDVDYAAVNALLQILRHYHPDLPRDRRTLVQTPRTTSLKKLPTGGEYVHFGIKSGIEKSLKSGHVVNLSDTVQLQFNVDGLPLFKSSGVCLWPILGVILPASRNEPFVVGLYCGKSKPGDLEVFFGEFVEEAKQLVDNGICIGGSQVAVELNSFVCDAPARAMLKNVKSHGGYYACEKCTQEGEWHGKVTYPETAAPLRKDVHFDELRDEDHHLGPSPLHALPVGMVTGFPLDYMHLTCLGVMKRLLICWLKGPLATRLCTRKVEQLTSNLLEFIPFIPREFCRKPRSVIDILRWKATELRQFLLYTGPVALLNVLPQPLYENFLLLFVGIALLCNPKLCEGYCDYASNILITCVENMKVLYGNGMIVYNVHGLVHLADDVRRFGVLDNFSAFPFENKLQSLKRLVRKPSCILQQIARRLHEKQNTYKKQQRKACTFKQQHSMGPVLPLPGMGYTKQYGLMHLDDTVVALNVADNCVAKKDGNPCVVRNILSAGPHTCLVVENFKQICSFFDYPLPSSSLNIYRASHLSGILELIDVADIACKCVKLPLNDESFVILPLLHSS